MKSIKYGRKVTEGDEGPIVCLAEQARDVPYASCQNKPPCHARQIFKSDGIMILLDKMNKDIELELKVHSHALGPFTQMVGLNLDFI